MKYIIKPNLIKSNVMVSKFRFCFLFVVIFFLMVFSTGSEGLFLYASPNPQNHDPLSLWNEGAIKNSILTFVKRVCDKPVDQKGSAFVPVEDRIAVFDMDGTILCENPLWLEARVAVEYLWSEVKRDSSLIKNDIYRYAYNYHENPNVENTDALEKNCVAMQAGAFAGWTQDEYIKYVKNFCATQKNPDYKIPYQYTFYAPMLQLIEYLLKNEFQVYIISGSEQSLIWSVCEVKWCNRKNECKPMVPLPRKNMVGSNIKLIPQFQPQNRFSGFIRGNMYYEPRNLYANKLEHINWQIGKAPIFAFGNSSNDFYMLSYTGLNRQHIGFLLDHDDKDREYVYPGDETKKKWYDVAKVNDWHMVSIKKDFKKVFCEPPAK